MGKSFIPRVAALCCFALATGCGDGERESGRARQVTPAPPGAPWETLDQWHLFENAARHNPADRVLPYDVIAPLYSDLTHKRRFIWIPDGTRIGYSATQRWQFPVGTILIKSFSYWNDARDPERGERLLETRLLVREAEAFRAHTYVWNEQQTAATRESSGATIPVTFIDAHGETRQNAYGVPNTNQCQECHGAAELQDALGGRTRQLDRAVEHDGKNQIEHLAEQGWFDRPIEPAAERQRLVDPFGSAPLNERVRAYLDANCGHCHSQARGLTGSGLNLSFEEFDPAAPTTANGICKIPTSAGGATCGLRFDIVPGRPEQSIFICRMASHDARIRMPQVGTKLPDDAGVALISEWIRSLPPAGCQ